MKQLRSNHTGRNSVRRNALRLLPHDYVSRAPVERLVTHLWGLGPRGLAEFLAGIGRVHGIADDIEHRLATYRRLSSEMLAAVGADKFAPSPTREIVP